MVSEISVHDCCFHYCGAETRQNIMAVAAHRRVLFALEDRKQRERKELGTWI
jgi:hypothetical protein